MGRLLVRRSRASAGGDSLAGARLRSGPATLRPLCHRRLRVTVRHMHYPGHAAQPGLPTVSYVTIDHLSGTPVYVQLAAILRGQIESGDLPPDRPLPSYTTLMQEHGIARGTAAKAVQ